LKIRIFKLAKELGLDHKELVAICGEVGVAVKSSPLASITPEQKDLVTEYLKTRSSSSAPVSEDSSPSAAPVRGPDESASARIRTMSARPTPRKRPSAADSEAADPAEATEATEATEAAEAAEPAEAADPAEAAEAAEAADQESVAEEGSDAAAVVAEESSSGPGEESLEAGTDESVMSLGSADGRIREMGSRPAPQTTARPNRRPRPKASLPSVAVPPAYKPPATNGGEEAAPPETQKPEIRLTADSLQQSPLAAHLRKSSEQKQREGEVPVVAPTKGGRRRGSLTEERRVGGMGLEESRQRRRDKRRTTDDDDSERRGRGTRRGRSSRSGTAELRTSAVVETPITIRSLSEATGRPARSLISTLFQQGVMVSINDVIDEQTALEIALECEVELEIKRPRDLEAELVESLDADEAPEDLEPRPPIVTILGHVDHGKTTLLDAIRSTNVVEGEAGGITQHIAAYQVSRDERPITFVDTPGHAAFGEMRARGANVTDIVVLVVAADDGVMPQTQECIAHAKAAGVPVIVALNKTDLPESNIEKVLGELAANEITPAEWGGDVEVIRTAALNGDGVDDLLETILLTAELYELNASVSRNAAGLCLEAFRDEGRGALAWLIVQTGTLKKGDVIVCGAAFGRVRAIYNDRDESIDSAGPSTPVRIAGLDRVPGAGDHFHVLDGIDEAREVAELRRERGRNETLLSSARPKTMEEILQAARAGEAQDLPLIIKGDTPGSIEALRGELGKFVHPEVRVQVLHHGVGGVNESDVMLAAASGAIIVAFHVVPDEKARVLADAEGVQVRRYDVIYEIIDHIKLALEGLLVPEDVEVSTGRAVVLQTFHISRFGTIAGSRVLNGTITRNDRIRVIRNQTVLNDYPIGSLRSVKDDVREVRRGMECGIRLEGFNDIKEGDELQAFRIDQVKRTLE
jgi:translation initiation factor IF-2